MFDDSFKKLYDNVPIAVWSYNSNKIYTKVHNHAEIEITLKTKGKSETNICNKRYITNPGDFIFKNPYEIHSSKALTEDSSGYCICFDCSLIADESIGEMFKNKSMCIRNHIPASDTNIEEIQRLFMNIIKAFEEKSQYMRLEIMTHISMLITFLLNNGFVTTANQQGKEEIFYNKVFQFISQNYTKNITSKDISDVLSYNHSYFCRKFRKSFDRQFYDYLNMYRVYESQKLFEDEEKNITQISRECGFNSQIYFTKCFKKYMGMLPSEYKQRIKGNIKANR